MGGPRLKRCRLGACSDRLVRGGRRVRCSKCGTEFPCGHPCAHLDCQAERDVPGSMITAELGIPLKR